MVANNSHWKNLIQSLVVIVTIVTLITPQFVPYAFAEENVAQDVSGGESGQDGQDGSTSEDGSASGSESGNTGSGEDGGSTEGGTDGGADGESGESGDGGAEDGADAPKIPVVTENSVDGTEGDDGVEGEEGSQNEDITGGISETGTTSAAVITGDASATGDIVTRANNTKVSSELEEPIGDLDTYTLTATGTNDALVDNVGTTSAKTGENAAEATEGLALIDTGDAFSVLNIANIINTNVINSTGFIYLINRLMEAGKSLDLRDLFFPDPEGTLAEAGTCSLVSCAAEDVVYNIDNLNNAGITNTADLEAISGLNEALGDAAVVNTGDAYAAANVLNAANTNIIDSNYILLALNALGDVDGDLVLPNADLFHAFFGKPNAVSRALQQDEEVSLNVDNQNNADNVDTDIDTEAESGDNDVSAASSTIKTGNAEAESNIINEINKNLFGGDSLFVMIKIHGVWNGTLTGLPEGLVWQHTPEGVLIYNEDAEIVPSQIVSYDIDSYAATIDNDNNVGIDNDLDLTAISGKNKAEGDIVSMNTGDAYAGANVMNIANTNVIGRNWVMATLNIFGDVNGDIAFGQPDLWVGGEVSSSDTPVGPGSKLTYKYTVKNNGDRRATGVRLAQILDAAYSYYAEEGVPLESDEQHHDLGSVEPGETVMVIFDAYVHDDLPEGTTVIKATAKLTSSDTDADMSDNVETLQVVAEKEAVDDGGSEGDTSQDSSNSGGGGSGGGGSSGGGGGGGGGGGSSSGGGTVLSSTISRNAKEAEYKGDANLRIRKKADFDEGEVIKAGTVVNYTVIVTNDGGTAYKASVTDTLFNPIGSVVSEQAWDLGDILPGERIELEYEVVYDAQTPSGTYENVARLTSYRDADDPKSVFHTIPAKHTIVIEGKELAIGNVDVLGVFSNGYGTSAVLLSWETTKPADGQVFLSKDTGVSPYNPFAFNNGYARASIYLPMYVTKHYMYIPNLTDGVTYRYRIHSSNGTHNAMGGDYFLTVANGSVVSTGAQVTSPTPSTYMASVASTPATPAPKPVTPPAKPEEPALPEEPAQPEPPADPEPAPQEASTSQKIGSFVGKLFGGLFR